MKLIITVIAVLFVGWWVYLVIRDFIEARRQIRDAEDMKRSANRE